MASYLRAWLKIRQIKNGETFIYTGHHKSNHRVEVIKVVDGYVNYKRISGDDFEIWDNEYMTVFDFNYLYKAI